jgi:dTDP-4-dehydrorhamnose 3,5-epimerase
MKIIPTPIPGCFEIIPEIFKDKRGSFVKTFSRDMYVESGLEYKFTEEYYSISKKNVLRGMHFQSPPSEHAKVVYCVEGSVWDVVIDIRKGSPTFARHFNTKLSDEDGKILYIPSGLAHGFFTLSETAIMVYKTTSQYDQAKDMGVLWSSFGIDWPAEEPLMSDRDRSFLKFSEFKSPFVFEK